MFSFLQKETCKFCGTKANKKKMFTLKIKASDGTLDIRCCKKCINDLEHIKESIKGIGIQYDRPTTDSL